MRHGNIIGFDPGGKKKGNAYAVLSPDDVVLATGIVRCRDDVVRVLMEWDVYFGVIEQIPNVHNDHVFNILSRQWGRLEQMMDDYGIEYTDMNVGTWKKNLCGVGNADKPKIKKCAIEIFGLAEDLQQDEYDAVGIAAAWQEGVY